MNNKIEYITPLIGRICLSFIFIMSGLHKITNWSGTAAYMEANGMFWIPLFLLGAMVFELSGGISLLLGFKTRIGAALLIVFLIPTTLIFHNFWADPPDQQQLQMIMFMKNLAILGGLLVVFGFGAGPISLDAKWSRPTAESS